METRLKEKERTTLNHPNFVLSAERSSPGDINPTSYCLAAFELINQLLYVNFPSLERKFS